jgi:arginine/lysine/ornithine decarboxylase
METSELNRENIQERLILVGVSESISQQLIAVLDSCEMGLYSSFGTENMKQSYEETLSILTNLEKEIGKTKK